MSGSKARTKTDWFSRFSPTVATYVHGNRHCLNFLTVLDAKKNKMHTILTVVLILAMMLNNSRGSLSGPARRGPRKVSVKYIGLLHLYDYKWSRALGVALL